VAASCSRSTSCGPWFPNAADRLGELESYNERKGPLFKLAVDPRVTRVGPDLRKTPWRL